MQYTAPVPAPLPLPPTALEAFSNINLGLLKPYMLDDSVSDILVNGTHSVYVERGGRLELAEFKFSSDKEVNQLAQTLVELTGRQMDPNRPLIDARLIDGSRLNIVGPPLAVDGVVISIRKFSRHRITLERMVLQKNISQGLSDFLQVAGRCRLNILVSGGTGSGKTTMLNALSQFIDPNERIVTVEDAAELQLNQPHVVRMETRPTVSTGVMQEAVTVRDLVRNALRMRPDRIIIGECRGPEAFDMLQAMNTGHEGSLTTVHANHPRDALTRLENMVSMANLNVSPRAVRAQIASALHLIVQVSRMRDGLRRITYISEITGMEGDVVTIQDLFHFVSQGEDAHGKVQGEFKWTGIVPRFMRRVAYWGELDRLGRALGVNLSTQKM